MAMTGVADASGSGTDTVMEPHHMLALQETSPTSHVILLFQVLTPKTIFLDDPVQRFHPWVPIWPGEHLYFSLRCWYRPQRSQLPTETGDTSGTHLSSSASKGTISIFMFN